MSDAAAWSLRGRRCYRAAGIHAPTPRRSLAFPLPARADTAALDVCLHTSGDVAVLGFEGTGRADARVDDDFFMLVTTGLSKGFSNCGRSSPLCTNLLERDDVVAEATAKESLMRLATIFVDEGKHPLGIYLYERRGFHPVAEDHQPFRELRVDLTGGHPDQHAAVQIQANACNFQFRWIATLRVGRSQ